MKTELNHDKKHRVITFLNREEIDFLDKLGKDALFSSGAKISRATLIHWMIDFMLRLNLNGKDIRTEKEFINRIVKVIYHKLSLYQKMADSQPEGQKGGSQ